MPQKATTHYKRPQPPPPPKSPANKPAVPTEEKRETTARLEVRFVEDLTADVGTWQVSTTRRQRRSSLLDLSPETLLHICHHLSQSDTFKLLSCCKAWPPHFRAEALENRLEVNADSLACGPSSAPDSFAAFLASPRRPPVELIVAKGKFAAVLACLRQLAAACQAIDSATLELVDCDHETAQQNLGELAAALPSLNSVREFDVEVFGHRTKLEQAPQARELRQAATTADKPLFLGFRDSATCLCNPQQHHSHGHHYVHPIHGYMSCSSDGEDYSSDEDGDGMDDDLGVLFGYPGRSRWGGYDSEDEEGAGCYYGRRGFPW